MRCNFFVLVSLFLGPVGTFAANEAPSTPKKILVGLVLDKGGRDDKSFNAAAYKGATEATNSLKLPLKVVESSDDAAIEPAFRTFAQRNYDLMVGIGFAMTEGMTRVAKEFPKLHFVLVDSPLPLPNSRSVVFREHEGSFVVGALAALKSKSKKIGFIGGMDVPLIRRFVLGYEAGAKHIDPKIEIISNYVGSTSDAWKNPMKGRELALKQYKSGVDIIFAAAGASGLAVFDVAEEQKKFVIGVDSNQNWIKPGWVLTSMIKRLDKAVYDAIVDEANGKFTPGELDLGLKENGVDYALDEHNRKLVTPEMEKKIAVIKDEIIKGKITVPDYYKIRGTGAGTSSPAQKAPAKGK